MNEIICGECPAIYTPEEIVARDGNDVETLSSLMKGSPAPAEPAGPPAAARVPRWKKALGVREAPPVAKPPEPASPGPDLGKLGRLRPWVFTCPQGHSVDGNSGSQFPVAVLGPSGSSKSHFLAAIVREMDRRRRLAPLNVTLTKALHQNAELNVNAAQVYEVGRQLPPTDPRDESAEESDDTPILRGPFGHRLSIRDASGDSSQYTLLLFDVAGEDLSSVVKVAMNARFILLCKAIVVLINPETALPTKFDNDAVVRDQVREDAAGRVRESIGVLADTLQEVWGLEDSRQLPIPMCFVVAKSDSVFWPDSFEWETQTENVLAQGRDGLDAALLQSSELVREALVKAGGDLIVQEIEDRFDADWVRYSAASATSAMPAIADEAGSEPTLEWEDYPKPEGVALSILQSLDLAGLLPEVSAPSIASRTSEGSDQEQSEDGIGQ